jgi:hypothetical protein
MGYDGDRETVYVREEKEVLCGYQQKATYPFRKFGLWHQKVSFGSHVVAFCGKVYHAIHLSMPNVEKAICYTIEDVDRFVETHLKEDEIEAFNTDRGIYSFMPGKLKYWNYEFNRRYLKKFFEDCEADRDRHEELFREYKSPIIIGHPSVYTHPSYNDLLVVNGNLKKVEFFRCPYFQKNEDGSYRYFDPFTTYQEISMYVGGVLGGTANPIPEVSDQDLLEAKGFHPKYSFRKPKASD